MKSKFAIALLTTTLTSVLTATLPIYAGPLESYNGSILDSKSEIASKETLASRALCSDIVAMNTSELSRTSEVDNSGKLGSHDKRLAAQINSSSKETNLGASYMGIGGTYGSKSAKNSSSNTESISDRNNEWRNSNKAANATKTQTAVTAGKNCDAVYTALFKAAAERDAAAYKADADVQMTKYATDAKLKASEAEARQKFLEGLLKW